MREERIWPNGLRYLWTEAFGLVLLVSLYEALREERYLEAKFGDAYHNYRISVRRYMCVQGPRLAAV